jgi:hypothetical protein
MVLSIVGSFFAFQDFATPTDERSESIKTEWIASRKIVGKNFAFQVFTRCVAKLTLPVNYRFIELNYSAHIRRQIASTAQPPRVYTNFIPEKTIAGLSDEDSLRSPG